MTEKIKRMLAVCRMLHNTGKVSGTGGNVSIRAGVGIYITPSGISLGEVTEKNLVFVRFDESYEGSIKPSKETKMHLKCYEKRLDVNAVVHVHSLYAVILSCLLQPGDKIPAYSPGYVMRVNDLPIIPYLKPGSAELAEVASAVISERNSVLLCNHGVITVGTDMSQALNIMEEIEKNAHIHVILNERGHALNHEAIEEILNG